MDGIARCSFADELEAAAAEQQRKGRQSPANMEAYSQSAAALRQVARKHAQTCEHCQTDRLLDDEAAARFEAQALAVTEEAFVLSGPEHSLAVAVMALAQDRRARMSPATPPEPCDDGAFAWRLTQERVDMVAHVLYKAETLINLAVRDSLEAENIGCLMTDLRAQCCVRDGADDPFPDTPMFPAFADTVIAPAALSESEAELCL